MSYSAVVVTPTTVYNVKTDTSPKSASLNRVNLLFLGLISVFIF